MNINGLTGLKKPLNRRITQFQQQPETLPNLYHVNDPSGNNCIGYKLLDKQVITVSRLLQLLVDGYTHTTIPELQEIYFNRYEEQISYSVIRAGLKLLTKAKYIDKDRELTSIFYRDCVGVC